MEIRKTYSNATKNLSYLLIGGGIGATLALLFAPKAGSELREDISSAASNGVEKTRETAGKIRENAANYYEAARENATNYYETAKDKANNLYNAVSTKTEEIVEDVKALPEAAESLISDKVDQINEAVTAGQKEYKKVAKSSSIL